MKDPLFEATQALRELGAQDSESSQLTRARVIAAVRRTQRKQLRRSIFAIPLAALAIGSAAMAATGGYLPSPVQRWVTDVTGITPKIPQHPKFKVARAPTLQPSPAESAPAAAGEYQPIEQMPLVSSSPLALAPEPSTKGVVVVAPASASDKLRVAVGESPITEAEFERYRLAHEAHFVKKDPAAALAAWTDYLAHAPSGQLAVEARYNQALCLLKLGRTQEARRALAPFVAGTYGAYRRQEAQALIATLDADAGR
jgi:hypothetical protein